jgi:ribosomal protein S20
MPILKHARKKLKQDKKRTVRNKKVKITFKTVVKKAKEAKSEKALSAAFKGIDKAVKANIIHKNKAARMKSSLSKMVGGGKHKASASTDAKTAAKPATKAKTAAKPEVKKSAKPAANTSKVSGAKAKKPSSKASK